MSGMKQASWDQVRKIENGAALGRAGAWVILFKDTIKGTVKAAYPKDGAGTLTVIIHEHGFGPQIGKAGGYGYDKLSAALHGAKFGDIILEDSGRGWENQLQDAGYQVYRVL
jgi:hypothetical protein